MCQSTVYGVVARRLDVIRVLVVATLLSMLNAMDVGAASVLSKIACGHHAQGEFTEAQQQHSYEIRMEAGTTLNVRAVPYGKVLRVRAIVYDPVEVQVADTRELSTEVTFDAGPLSANGLHKIIIQNFERYSRGSAVGLYDIYIKCTDRAGQTIEAGTVGGGGFGGAPAPVGVAPPGPENAVGNSLGALDQTLGRLAESPEMSKYQKDVEEARSYARIAKEAAGIAQAFSGMFGGRKKRKQQEAELERLRLQVQVQQSGYVAPGQPMAQPIYQGPGLPASTGAVQAPPMHAAPIQAAPIQAAPMQAAPMVAQSFGPRHVSGMTFVSAPLGSVLEGQVTPSGDVAGSRFTLVSATRVKLGFERVGGALHLDLLVLDTSKNTIFDTRLRANSSIDTMLDLPAGEYTVAIRAAEVGVAASAARFRLRFGAEATSRNDSSLVNQGSSMVPVPPANSGRLVTVGEPGQSSALALASGRQETAGVTLFGAGQFTGSDAHYDRDQADLRGTDVANYGVGSVRLSPGCRVLLYSEPSFTGPATMLESDEILLRPRAQVRSLRVRCE